MSYGHYWGREKAIPGDAFTAVADDARRIIADVAPALGLFGGIKVKGPTGSGAPIIDADHICFNGSPAKETFWIARDVALKSPGQAPDEQGVYWDFVKTGSLPYDTVVVAVLIALKTHVPHVRLSSDGGEREWATGIALYQRATGRTVSFDSLTR